MKGRPSACGSDSAAQRKAERPTVGVGWLARWPRKTRRAVLVGAGAAVVLGMGLYFLFGPLSPDAVCRRSLQAIDRRDVGALLRLARPEEVQRLNLTQKNVAAMLKATVWRGGGVALGGARIEPEDPEHRPVDRRVYSIYAHGANPESSRAVLAVAVSDSQDHGWSLDLTWLLFTYCKLRDGGIQGRLEYARLCRECGIAGMFGYDAGYLDIADIERRARDVAGSSQ